MPRTQPGSPGTWTTQSGCSARTARAPRSGGAARSAAQAARAKPPGCPRRRAVGGHRDHGPGLQAGHHPVHGGRGHQRVVGGVQQDGVGARRLGLVEAAQDGRQHAVLGPRVLHELDLHGRRSPPRPRERSWPTDRDHRGHAGARQQARHASQEGLAPDAQQRLGPADAPSRARGQHYGHDPHPAVLWRPVLRRVIGHPGHHHGSRRARLPQLQHRLPRRPGTQVVAFTAAQIPNIEGRRYPPELAGPRYPEGIPIHPEADLAPADPRAAAAPGRARLQRRVPRGR